MTLPNSPQSQTLDYEQFTRWVHETLGRLYDSAFLQNHPLTRILTSSDGNHSQTRSQEMRRILLGAIETLRPKAGIPAQSPDWRLYRILELRFIEGLAPVDVMLQLNLAKSQFYRDQAKVLDLIVNRLWQQVTKKDIDPRSVLPDTSNQNLSAETDRLQQNTKWEILNLVDVIRETEHLTSPLARQKNVNVIYQFSGSEIYLLADRIMLRQIIINMLGYAISITQNRLVNFSAHQGKGRIDLELLTGTTAGFSPVIPRQGITGIHQLDICENLMALLHGSIAYAQNNETWIASLTWFKSQERILLVVDDHSELADLYHRYLIGTGWQLTHAPTSADARRFIQNTKPDLVLLDIMLPGEDGWEFLESMKANENTRDIPVIICSVVGEPALAASLGASGCLAKPISQQMLLQALLPWGG
ncbi:MAG TPA: response regulator [Anaerolineaceae bacterium]